VIGWKIHRPRVTSAGEQIRPDSGPLPPAEPFRADHHLASAAMSDQEKVDAARAAAQLVADGQLVGLGTGTTVAHLLPALAARALAIRCVATSPETERVARALGLDVVPFTGIERLDIAIDGADQIDADGWLVKGGGGAHTREKVVAAAAARFVVIASSEKAVARIGPPIPLELLRFGVDATLGALGEVRLRAVPPSPDGGVIADYLGSFENPAALTARLDATPGLVGHGIFPPDLTADILLAANGRVEHRVLR
jgi:ribose 5-phosphate isomerase A